LLEKKLDLVICIPKEQSIVEHGDTYRIRRATIDLGVPLINNTKLARLFIRAISKLKLEDLKIKAWEDY